jgi:hypothetical protein
MSYYILILKRGFVCIKGVLSAKVTLPYVQIRRIMALVFLKRIVMLNEESLIIASNLSEFYFWILSARKTPTS